MADDQNKKQHEDDVTSGIASELTGEDYTTNESNKKGDSATESGSEQITGQTYDDSSADNG